MADRSQMLIRSFNTKMIEFVDEMILLLPEERQFRLYKTALDVVRSATPRFTLKFFNENVIVPYGDKILEKDESFFLEKVLTTELSASHEDLSIIPKLRAYWADFSEENKNAVWAYLQLLHRIVTTFLQNDTL